MTLDEVLAFARQLPPTVTRIQVPVWVEGGKQDVLIVEQQPASIVRAVPEIGDVEKARRVREEKGPSDVDSLSKTPPEWKD